MEGVGRFPDLFEHIARTTRLAPAEAERVVADVLQYFCEPVEQFVVRRHAELQAENLRNVEIFARIGVEVRDRRFAVSGLSERQVRRMIYG